MMATANLRRPTIVSAASRNSAGGGGAERAKPSPARLAPVRWRATRVERINARERRRAEERDAQARLVWTLHERLQAAADREREACDLSVQESDDECLCAKMEVMELSRRALAETRRLDDM